MYHLIYLYFNTSGFLKNTSLLKLSTLFENFHLFPLDLLYSQPSEKQRHYTVLKPSFAAYTR